MDFNLSIRSVFNALTTASSATTATAKHAFQDTLPTLPALVSPTVSCHALLALIINPLFAHLASALLL
jgi:hypothetical protein